MVERKDGRSSMVDWLTLLWWLGPWCDQTRAPNNIQHQDCSISFRFRVYRPRRYSKAVMVLPGLHPDGIDDARLDRFCRVLASAGVLVGIPELPTMMRSMMEPKLLDETTTAGEHFYSLCCQEGFSQFGVFCISASSIAGLHLANHPTFESRVSRVHLFGGFADWKEALRFAMTGQIQTVEPPVQLAVDPLSLPVVYMNLLSCFPSFITDALELPTSVRDVLIEGLFEYVSLSWEKPAVEHPTDTKIIAERIVQNLEIDCGQQVDEEVFAQRFFEACAVRSGGQERVHKFLDGLVHPPQAVSWLDPEPLLRHLTVPLDVSHGRDDFVVPYPQADTLVKWAPRGLVHCYVTGLYHHTGTVSIRRLLSMLLGLPTELWTSMQMVWALSKLGK